MTVSVKIGPPTDEEWASMERDAVGDLFIKLPDRRFAHWHTEPDAVAIVARNSDPERDHLPESIYLVHAHPYTDPDHPIHDRSPG